MTASTTSRSTAATVSTVTATDDTTQLIRIHATLTGAGPAGTITGLHPDTADTTRDRLYAAIHNAGLRWPAQHVAIEAAPTALPAHDPGLDAVLAVALLAVTGQLPTGSLGNTVIIGELGLDGSLRTPRAVAERLTAAAGAGMPLAVIPSGGRNVADTVPGISVWLAGHLRELAAELRIAAHDANSAQVAAVAAAGGAPGWPSPGVPVADLAGLPAGAWQARRVLEVAAAGGHHLMVTGPPAATTALARCLPGLLPDLDDDTSRQVADLYRAAGLIPAQVTMLRRPPWQAPHHSCPTTALIGSLHRPGAVSLAHGGVLHLDHAAAFSSRVVEALCQPLDAELVRLTGATRTVTYPARTQLVMTTQDCPCDDPGACTCTPARRRRHLHRLQPLLDRAEIQAVLPAGPAQPLGRGEPSAVVAARVAAARAAAAARWAPHVAATNHGVPDAILQHSVARIRAADLRRCATRSPRAPCPPAAPPTSYAWPGPSRISPAGTARVPTSGPKPSPCSARPPRTAPNTAERRTGGSRSLHATTHPATPPQAATHDTHRQRRQQDEEHDRHDSRPSRRPFGQRAGPDQRP